MYLDQNSFGNGIYPKTYCELNYMFEGFSCKFPNLAMAQSHQGLSCDIFDKRFQLEYACTEMISTPRVQHSNIFVIVKLRVINIQFYKFLWLCSCKTFFNFQVVNLCFFCLVLVVVVYYLPIVWLNLPISSKIVAKTQIIG
jgi:hypothetical protein